MSKELTEQWRDGTLPKGLYYTRSSSGRKGFSFHTGSKRNMFSPYDRMAHQIEQVLAPVPDYNDHKQLVSKNDALEKKLEIAKKALDDILNDGDDYWDKDKAQEALTKMEGVK